MSDMRETILATARPAAQAHGYGGLSFRELAKQIGIKSASIHYHFPTKGDLAATLARRYTDDAARHLENIRARWPDPAASLRHYAGQFRLALENGNRMCLCGLLAAEHDELPDMVKAEVMRFVELNIAWLTDVLLAGPDAGNPEAAHRRAQAIYAAIAGAQLAARGRADIGLYDMIVESYRTIGLIPA